jgi:hypothetical protein
MSDVVNGSCHGGEIEFDWEASDAYGPGGAMGVCHCSRCRQWSGGSDLASVVVESDHFRVTKRQNLLVRYQPEGYVDRVSCGRCGSSIYSAGGTEYYVSAGVLQDPKLKPVHHLNVAYKAPWHEIGGDPPQSAELQSGSVGGQGQDGPRLD